MAGEMFRFKVARGDITSNKEICSQGKFRANNFLPLKFCIFEPFAKLGKISPHKTFPSFYFSFKCATLNIIYNINIVEPLIFGWHGTKGACNYETNDSSGLYSNEDRE